MMPDANQLSWSPDALKHILKEHLHDQEIITVSNREPYQHVYKECAIKVQSAAGGLVTALEPIMRACSGTWIAHGSGDADRETVDAHDHVAVPPDKPAYQLRRIWLSQAEEDGYYDGFANEGLWPLCHMAHNQPSFRSSDWEMYQQVNRKFAHAVIQEAHTENPVVLIQDYHFALLPGYIHKKLPNATIITFWHIPWPNVDIFSICPWPTEILVGLLGSSILGFHTQNHCNNFFECVDRFLESRIDRETLTVSYHEQLTAVRAYPISIAWPEQTAVKHFPEIRKKIIDENYLSENISIGLGVDRMDYTKGILERFYAIERLLELYPEWIGKFVFIQIAAPTRSTISNYQKFENEVRELSDRINERFAHDGYHPICLRIAHHDSSEVDQYYIAADVCFVSSLHDGMNLIAKEFIAQRTNEQGVLVLSKFTGAASELSAALIVNPYHVDECAEALHLALTMPIEEQRQRMISMRSWVKEFNVYRWAGRMLTDAVRLRQDKHIADLTPTAIPG